MQSARPACWRGLLPEWSRRRGGENGRLPERRREVREHHRTEGSARSHHAARERLFSSAVESSDDAIVMQSLDAIITGWKSSR